MDAFRAEAEAAGKGAESFGAQVEPGPAVKPAGFICVGADPAVGGAIDPLALKSALQVGKKKIAVVRVNVAHKEIAIPGDSDIFDPKHLLSVITP